MTQDTLATRISDAVHSPSHYTHSSGVECKDIAKHLSFALGNAFKYVWRAGRKDYTNQDLRKALECIAIELSIKRIERSFLNSALIHNDLARLIAADMPRSIKDSALESLALANCFDNDGRQHRLEMAKQCILDMLQ